MKYNRLSFLSILIASGLIPNMSDAAIRITNVSRNKAQSYQQYNNAPAMPNHAQAYQQLNNQYQAAIPMPVTGQAGAGAAMQPGGMMAAPADGMGRSVNAPANADGTVIPMEQCSMIYPTGEFTWSVPMVGTGAGGAQTCTAVVEMRAIGAGENGEDAVVARATLAAGDAVRCNIFDFPEISWLPDAGNVEFPHNTEPTVDDVIKVMNQEQKQNAGLKIAAGTVLFGLAGNMAGKNDPGKEGLLGTSKSKTTGTLIGALGGAALMAGHTYGGKVAGDTILSTGVNATAGAVVGNMAASGDAVLRIEKCKIPTDTTSTETDDTNNDKKDTKTTENKCLWGMLVEEIPITITTDAEADLKDDNVKTEVGKRNFAAFFNLTTDETIICDLYKDNKYQNCTKQELINIKLKEGGQSPEEAAKQRFDKIRQADNAIFTYNAGEATVTQGSTSGQNEYAMISGGAKPGTRRAAMIAGVKDKTFGIKRSEWSKLKSTFKDDQIWGRDNMGRPFKLSGEVKLENFHPMYVDADDGALIDLGNKARLKGTLVGAGVGGALGAYSGYQGAMDDIDQRWVAAVREYKDSLQKVYCVTGDRFLSYYNDMIMIPDMSVVNEPGTSSQEQ